MSGESQNTALIRFKGQLVPLEQIYKNTFRLLLAKARIMLNDIGRSEDVVQDLFMNLWERKDIEIRGNSIEAYLVMSMHYKCLNLLNKQQQMQKKMEKYAQELVLMQEANTSFFLEGDCLNNKLSLLELGKESLSHNQREAILKIFDEEKSLEQTAAEMCIKRNTLNSHLERSLVKFRNIFQQRASYITVYSNRKMKNSTLEKH